MKRRLKYVAPALVALSLTLFSFGGTKEEIIRLQSDVLQLQDQIRLLQKSIDEKNGIIVSLLEQLNDQSGEGKLALQDVQQAVTAGRAQAENMERSIASLSDEFQLLSTKLDDTNNRIAGLSRKMEESQMQVQSLRSVPGPNQAGGDVEPDRVYSASYNDYLMGNYALAVDGFQDFLANYPDSEYADNAAYYLGDAYMQQGRLELAVQAFDQVINLYPKGDKTPVAYYKKALALEQMQQVEQAVDVLKKLMKLYPKSQEATLAEQELQKLGM
jgi:tol-pal system protein YbgF